MTDRYPHTRATRRLAAAVATGIDARGLREATARFLDELAEGRVTRYTDSPSDPRRDRGEHPGPTATDHERNRT